MKDLQGAFRSKKNLVVGRFRTCPDTAQEADLDSVVSHFGQDEVEMNR
jgi:hypothetical protein